MRLAACLLVVAAACNSQTGTIDVTLTTAPGSALLDSVETLKLVLTNPHQTQTATRTNGTFSIELDLNADTGDTGALIIDGLDAAGNLVATGDSPPFPIGALDASIVVYMAPPNSIGASPAQLAVARSRVAAGTLSYGAIFAGGTDATGAPSDTLEIYNAFTHTMIPGLALPSPRTGIALGVGTSTFVYLFGGDDATGAATSTALRFDTSIAPNGTYLDLTDKTGFERADQSALTLDNEAFVITGTPPGVLSGADGSMTALTGVPSLPAAGASVIDSSGDVTVITADASGVTRFRNSAFDTIAAPAAARDGASVVALDNGKIGVVCGGPDMIVIDAAAATTQTFPMLPSTPRTGCAVASTASFLVVAGGTLAAGGVATTAEIFDAMTFAPVTTQPLIVPRTNAIALALPNGQVLIAGGLDATGAPTATIELFTPAPAE